MPDAVKKRGSMCRGIPGMDSFIKQKEIRSGFCPGTESRFSGWEWGMDFLWEWPCVF